METGGAQEDPLTCLDLVFTTHEASPFPLLSTTAGAKAAGAGTGVEAGAKPQPKPKPSVKEVVLMEGGETKAVTSDNVRDYVTLACRRRLLRGADAQITAIRQGLLDVIPG